MHYHTILIHTRGHRESYSLSQIEVKQPSNRFNELQSSILWGKMLRVRESDHLNPAAKYPRRLNTHTQTNTHTRSRESSLLVVVASEEGNSLATAVAAPQLTKNTSHVFLYSRENYWTINFSNFHRWCKLLLHIKLAKSLQYIYIYI